MKAFWKRHILDFKFAAGTSRGVLHSKPTVYLFLEEKERQGIGECSTIAGLSPDNESNYDEILHKLCSFLNDGLKTVDEILFQLPELVDFPSILFGLETALLDLKSGGNRILFQNDFSNGLQSIPINGLVWMGDVEFMNNQIEEKIKQGYRCIKLKIGALDFNSEIEILRNIRSGFSSNDLEIRLDANGAFAPENALYKLDELSKYTIHSIEQPIRAGQINEMTEICLHSPIPVALDEELIGRDAAQAAELLSVLKPAYIILKPSMLGGFKLSEKWIKAAQSSEIDWWVTSALESNVGLNAIAQWTSTLNNPMPQGLGTGQLYTNNIPSPLKIKDASLWYDTKGENWDFSILDK